MKTKLLVLLPLITTVLALADTSTSAPPTPCSKTVSFAVAEGGQPVPAIPKFAAKWLGKSIRKEGFPSLCLSQIPSSKTYNYLVLFSSSEDGFQGLTPSSQTYTSGAASGAGPGTTGYGGTWNYTYSGPVPANTTNTLDLQRADKTKKGLVIRAYSQQGLVVSHQLVSDEFHSRENVLQRVLGDIERDPAQPSPQKKVAAPLSVYYVNCGMDDSSPVSPAIASAKYQEGPPQPIQTADSPVLSKPEPPRPNLELASYPAAAEVYVDGNYVGRTPFSLGVDPGSHFVTIRKQDFTTWQETVRVSSTGRRVTAYLERKLLQLR
jgi:hypothetical protein